MVSTILPSDASLGNPSQQHAPAPAEPRPSSRNDKGLKDAPEELECVLPDLRAVTPLLYEGQYGQLFATAHARDSLLRACAAGISM
jgi:hypothetical protein